MHRFFVLIILFLSIFSLPSHAQFTKGTRMAGASVASIFFNSGNSEQNETTIGGTTAKVTGYGVNLTPSLGWFLSENTAVGFSLLINPSGEKVSFEENGSLFQRDKVNSFNIGLGGFARNYFGSSGSLLPFGQVSIDAGMANRKTEGVFYGGTPPTVYKETYEGKSTGGFFTNMIVTAGVTKMVGKYTGLDFFLGYNFYYTNYTMNKTTLRDDGIDGSIEETRPNETVTKFTNHRFVVGVAFQVFLEKKKK
jgi:hypothetical protein